MITSPASFFGMLLAAAIFWMGMIFSPQHPSQSTQQPATESATTKGADTPQPHDETGWPWITKDAAGFFTFLLVLVGGLQALLFYVQLKAIREALGPAKDAAAAAKAAAEHIPTVEGAYVYVLEKGSIIEFRLNSIESGSTTMGFPMVRLSLKNFGKTPASIVRWGARLDCVPIRNGEYREFLVPPDTILGENNETDGVEIALAGLSPDEATRVKKSSAHIILNGLLSYTDIWGVEWTVRFNGRYDRMPNRFFIAHETRQKQA